MLAFGEGEEMMAYVPDEVAAADGAVAAEGYRRLAVARRGGALVVDTVEHGSTDPGEQGGAMDLDRTAHAELALPDGALRAFVVRAEGGGSGDMASSGDSFERFEVRLPILGGVLIGEGRHAFRSSEYGPIASSVVTMAETFAWRVERDDLSVLPLAASDAAPAGVDLALSLTDAATGELDGLAFRLDEKALTVSDGRGRKAVIPCTIELLEDGPQRGTTKVARLGPGLLRVEIALAGRHREEQEESPEAPGQVWLEADAGTVVWLSEANLSVLTLSTSSQSGLQFLEAERGTPP